MAEPREIIAKAVLGSYHARGYWNEGHIADAVLSALPDDGLTICRKERGYLSNGEFVPHPGGATVRFVPVLEHTPEEKR